MTQIYRFMGDGVSMRTNQEIKTKKKYYGIRVI